ncbi:MAG: CDP-alcohol phosphatidyltransferase family protein [Chloroflexi bacterium]|nr:CDP-alcohol phosphatidyltransferase family protein [Chloroflexota bacterium]
MAVANLITVLRFPLLLGFLLMLYFGNPGVQLLSVPYLFFALFLDTVDGVIARRTGTTSLMGSVLDIATDRTYELVLWIVLADLGTISVAIPLIVIVRTTLTDAIRSIGVSQGKAPFEQEGSGLGHFVVSSPWMRSSYSISKIVAFCGLTLGYALSGFPQGSNLQAASDPILRVSEIVAWVAVVFSVVRGTPVILSGYRQMRGSRKASTPR